MNNIYTYTTYQYISQHICTCNRYGVATISRRLEIVGRFGKRALLKRRYCAQETYNLKEPANRSHPIYIRICTHIFICTCTYLNSVKFMSRYVHVCIPTACKLCNTLQHTATHCNTQHHIASYCYTLQHAATHCTTLHLTASHCTTLQHTAAHCNKMQDTTTHCNAHRNTLHHTATLCNKYFEHAETHSH